MINKQFPPTSQVSRIGMQSIFGATLELINVELINVRMSGLQTHYSFCDGLRCSVFKIKKKSNSEKVLILSFWSYVTR